MKYIVIDTFNKICVCTDEYGETMVFDDREDAVVYASDNCQEYVIVKL